jgi:DNA-binding PadR family transcriptional regulator
MSTETLESRRLTTTSYALLTQLALKPWSAYELVKQRVRYFRYVWPAAESAIYREIKKLADGGLATASKEHTGRRPRTVYTITDTGLSALREWLASPLAPFAMEFEVMLRLFVAPIGTREQLMSSLEQVKADAREMLRFGGEVKREYLAGRGALQDMVYIRALAIDFFISLLNMVDSWVTRTLDEVARWGDMTLEERNARGMEILAKVPVEMPAEPSEETPVAPARQTPRRRR